jgi:hypothetical protein
VLAVVGRAVRVPVLDRLALGVAPILANSAACFLLVAARLWRTRGRGRVRGNAALAGVFGFECEVLVGRASEGLFSGRQRLAAFRRRGGCGAMVAISRLSSRRGAWVA